MALWDKVRQELENAGKIAQGALDEGKVRLEAFRARQRADQAAQALGYAVYRARQQGQELDSDTYARLSSTLAGHEAEAARHESRLAAHAEARRTGNRRGDAPAGETTSAAPADAATATSTPPAAPSEPGAESGTTSSSSSGAAPGTTSGTTAEAPPGW